MRISEFTRYFVPLGNEVCPPRGLKKVENTEAVFWARFENILDSACPQRREAIRRRACWTQFKIQVVHRKSGQSSSSSPQSYNATE